jgi:cytosine/adenosine deaminase-related metal-dependent hydrolase
LDSPSHVAGHPDLQVIWTNATPGTLAAGKEADFVALDGNPLENIAHMHTTNNVYLRGAEVDRPALRANFLAGTK